MQDEDSLFVADYINEYLKNSDLFTFGIMEMVERKLGEFVGDIKICQKWLWLNNYANNKILSMIEK